MADARSRKAVFVSHCMLAQCVMAEGVAKHFAGMVKPVVEFCMRNDVNIMQMPCPETMCGSGGLGRSPRGKAWYEQNGLRQTSEEIARGQADYVVKLLAAGIDVLGVIGVDFSPACAVNYLNKGRSIIKGEGIYVEELRRALTERGISLPFVGISGKWQKKMVRDLELLLSPTSVELLPEHTTT
jgi:predicted secreted protein